MRKIFQFSWVILTILAVAVSGIDDVSAKKKKKKKGEVKGDPYAELVWPQPPDEPRIKLEAVLSERADVEAGSKTKRTLMSLAPQSEFDKLKKPFGIEFDRQGRILVTEPFSGAILRFDREGQRLDVLGTRSSVPLKFPLGLDVDEEGVIYVADSDLKQVLTFDEEGKLLGAFGAPGELTNPTDAAVATAVNRLYVTDSKAHRIVVFDLESKEKLFSFGRRGEGDGELAWPTSLKVGPEGELFVVDQINARVQVFDLDGKYLDQFGARGVGFSNFSRPKDIAVDEVGFIYVTDNAFNNVQLFDADFSLLTFIGEGGKSPGRFYGASGVAVRGDEFAVVDQLGRRVQVFRFLIPKDQ